MSKNYYEEDIRNTFSLFEKGIIKNCKILVTGATGMICSCIVDMLMQWNAELDADNVVYATSRNFDKLKKRFAKYEGDSHLQFLELDVATPFSLDIEIDYIIHGASNADPANMMKNPVETLKSNVVGMDCLLSYAVRKSVKRILYISSGEMYGNAIDNMPNGFEENYSGYIDYSKPRACYPSGKRAAETLCQCYISQYNSDIVIVRPCHVYGPTMLWTDSRAISAFIRNGINKEEIVMKSTGELVRSHCYVIDAASAILYVLVYGESGQAYNIADKSSVCSIAELAGVIAKTAGTRVEFDLPSEVEKAGYSGVNQAILNPDKLERLGWKAQTSLESGIKKTLEIMQERRL